MRQLSTYILSMIVMGSLAACSDNGEAGGKIPSADPPIELRATYPDTSISTKAEVGEAEAFKTTLFCVTRLDAITGVPDYTSLADRFSTPVSDVTTSWADAVFYEEWVERTADVAVGGSISWDASRKHHYPRMGANVYLVGVSPVAGDNSYDAAEGTVSYTLDGHMDLMYAGPLAGNKWDGNRFTGNTVAGVEANRSLNYAHLLTQLVFKAKKHDAGGLEVKVNKIIVKSIPTAVNVPLATGEADRLVESTRIARALGTYRGLAPADRTLIAQMLCRLSVLAALIPAIRDLTINPLVWTDGGAAIDADVNLNEAPVESEPGYPHLTVCAPPWEEGREVVFGGEALTLRTFVQSDFHPLKRFLERLSEKTFYLRFHTSVHLSDERICELASLDYAREAAWALAKDGEIHAVARWRLTGELGEAEFGIVVEDAWQRRGLARVLMAHIETTASERGVTRLVGHVLKGNEAMQGMMTAMGYTLGEGDSRDTDPWVKDISIPTNLL